MIDISAEASRLLGRAASDAELQTFLQGLAAWPLPPFPADEFDVFVERRSQGFALNFEDAAVVKHPSAAGKPARTPLLTGAFFHAEGKDGYRQFQGPLPHATTFADTADSLIARLGPPKFTITSKKSERLASQRWEADGTMSNVRYGAEGIEIVYVGLVPVLA